MKLIKIKSNLHKLQTKEYDVYFSYETPIAVKSDNANTFFVCENKWSRTTGKHISIIKETEFKTKELTYEDFKTTFYIITGMRYVDSY